MTRYRDLLTLHSFQIRNADVAAYLTTQPVEHQATAFMRAVEVGVFCLERASSAKDTEFLKRQVERLVNEIDSRVSGIPNKIQDELMKKVGSGDGQVLKPILDASELASRDVKQRIADCKLLLTDIDPTKDSSSVGKALKGLKDMLDPGRKDSIQGSLDSAVAKIVGEEGALAKAVKATVEDAMRPLQNEVKDLAKEIRGQEAAQEALMQTTAKGRPYEDEIVEVLQRWAKTVGAELQHVGGDNRPGDILIKMTESSMSSADLTIVIEARERTTNPVGRKRINDELTAKMAERCASAGIYLCRSCDGLAREVGDWCEGECELGSWVATTHEHLHTAIRFLIAMNRLRAIRSELPELDGTAICNQIQRIRTAMDRVKTINGKVTSVNSAADEIRNLVNSLRDDVREALNSIEEAIRKAGANIK
jgi:hypothetical protein